MQQNDILCDEHIINNEIINKVKTTIKPEEKLFDLADLFKVLGESSRIKILSALEIADMCVCDLAEALSMTQSAVSHQLRILRSSRLVKSRRDGKSIIYSLDDGHIFALLKTGYEHLEEER